MTFCFYLYPCVDRWSFKQVYPSAGECINTHSRLRSRFVGCGDRTHKLLIQSVAPATSNWSTNRTVTYRLAYVHSSTNRLIRARIYVTQIQANIIIGHMMEYSQIWRTTKISVASPIAFVSIVCPTICSDQRNHQSSALLVCLWGEISYDRWILIIRGQ